MLGFKHGDLQPCVNATTSAWLQFATSYSVVVIKLILNLGYNCLLQYSKLAKSETLVKELYCENSQLMRALQLTESRQKEAERRCQDEKDRAQALGRLLKKVCPDVV